MALFAAYSDANQAEEGTENEEWLSLSSFKVDLAPDKPAKSKVLEPSRSKSKKAKKTKRKDKTEATSSKKAKIDVVEVSDEFIIDTKRTPEFNTVKTISRPSAPRYHIKYRVNCGFKRRKRFKRYYHRVARQNLDESESEAEGKNDKDFTGFQHEEEMTRNTAFYNRSLADDPHNVELWIKYINFQDTVFQFEKTFRKGSIAKGMRVTAERKLSILDKALSHNPVNEELLRTRLNIAVSVYPADELQMQLGKLVEKEQGNIILWQGYIEATQCSMSHCTTPSVLTLYIKCLHTLHTLRRTAKLDKAQLEENILRMLYQCGLFLKQAGLFEQLWTLLHLYLELNLSPENESKFGLHVAPNEKQLVDLEEVVLNSQLPIHELWLRVEKLREACHWLPHKGGDCEDPQRVVFSEDVSELIHPITMPGNTFKLTVTILALLKVPLLPCRHTTMQEFGIDYVPWALDSIETLLPIFFPIYPVNLSNKSLLRYTQKLAVGPQYVKTLPGQEEYLQFVLTIMRSCMDCLTGDEQTAIGVWWLRFQRLLAVIEKEELFKITSAFKKKLKSDTKHVLKANSANVVLYREFALNEVHNGNSEIGVSILETTINTAAKSRGILSVPDEERAALCGAFKSLIEIQLSNPQKCLKYFTIFVRGGNLTELPRFLTQTALVETKAIFVESMAGLLENYEYKSQGVDHFLPNFTIDWIICYGWFLYLNDTYDDCRILLQNVTPKLGGEHKELLHEFLVALTFKECTEKVGSGLYSQLDSYVRDAIEAYPNNLFLLATLAKIQSMHYCMGQPWWRIKNVLLKTGHALSTLFLILIANQRICDIEEGWRDGANGQTAVTESSFKNRMLSLFRRLTRGDTCTRRCGLVWRLYLQFLHAYFEPKVCRDAYYVAVEECPWLKALYVDAAIYIPEELPQIQDLIIEKQLRIHVTPEELEVLRN